MTPLPSVVFLDRDGTIIRDVHYLSKPDQVELLDGAAEAIRRLNDARIPVIVATNQSGIGRGYFTVEEYERARQRLDELLRERGAHIDASYFCPHAPGDGTACDCRKPLSGLFRKAVGEHTLDMSSPAFVGDRWRDLAAADELGGRAILLRSESTPAADIARANQSGVRVMDSLAAAIDSLLGSRALRRRVRIAVLASGGGSNLQAIVDHFAKIGSARSGDVVLVGSNRADAGAISRAERAGIPAEVFGAADGDALDSMLSRHSVDLVALAGYLRLIPLNVIQRYRDRIVNVHPGPLPDFGGRGMHGTNVHKAVLASGMAETAVTVHLVDERYDSGAVLARWPVPVDAADTVASLAERVLAVEHIIYPRILDALAATLASGSVMAPDTTATDANRASISL